MNKWINHLMGCGPSFFIQLGQTADNNEDVPRHAYVALSYWDSDKSGTYYLKKKLLLQNYR